MRFLALLLVCGCGEKGFTKEDIDKTKASIRAKLGKQDGVEITELVLMKESANKLTGFVKIRVGGREVGIDCEATYYPDNPGDEKTLWKCPGAQAAIARGASGSRADVDLARIQVGKWKADLDMWALAAKSDKACAEISLREVGKFSTNEEVSGSELRDPWGKPIQIMCSDAGVRGIYSFGPNKRDDAGDGDDVASWRAR